MTYVPFRNANLLCAAVSWTEVMGAQKIFIGAVEQDSPGYPATSRWSRRLLE
jgi:7-cyano-7-deazaguanine synthase